MTAKNNDQDDVDKIETAEEKNETKEHLLDPKNESMDVTAVDIKKDQTPASSDDSKAVIPDKEEAVEIIE